ncbi:TetR/AcrR family transcriptional regulator [Ruania zhangjianzhongii]|uniref:TetR/AcrR family transcriptional regulator n=1 Tax=Ruania zhangjianzhongii TaxID=2603206 RepID=UPI0011C782BF|nr:TetR/AcrR family transcriptional regulator [Ruania zhangjianzhongii]
MNRREQISRAAFASIAERGFEGLRMRDVAERAEVNIATVHYYYGSKEQLIHAAYDELQARFRATVRPEGTAAERLTEHLLDVREILLGDDALRGVLSEIALRARRDPALESAITTAENTWFGQLQGLLDAGVADGSWAVPVNPGATAAMLIALCKGACLPVLATARRTELVSAFDQVLLWLTGPQPD